MHLLIELALHSHVICKTSDCLHSSDGHAYKLNCLQAVSSAQGQAELVQLTPAAGVALQRRQPFLRLLLGAAQRASGEALGTQQASGDQLSWLPSLHVKAYRSAQGSPQPCLQQALHRC